MKIYCVGALLIGGHSTRMGRDKALLPANEAGDTLLAVQLEKLRKIPSLQRILLSGRAEQKSQHPEVLTTASSRAGEEPYLAWIEDTWPDSGPFGGIASVLQASQADLCLVLAVDMPNMTAEILTALLNAAQLGCGAVVRHGDFYEPLAAVYPREMLPLATAMLESRQLRLQEFVAYGVSNGHLSVVSMPAAWEAAFLNWNEPTTRLDAVRQTAPPA